MISYFHSWFRLPLGLRTYSYLLSIGALSQLVIMIIQNRTSDWHNSDISLTHLVEMRLFYSHFYGQCSIELTTIFPLPFAHRQENVIRLRMFAFYFNFSDIISWKILFYLVLWSSGTQCNKVVSQKIQTCSYSKKTCSDILLPVGIHSWYIKIFICNWNKKLKLIFSLQILSIINDKFIAESKLTSKF